MSTDDDVWMRVALDEAARAEAWGDVPVGAVVVRAGVEVGRGRNEREALGDPTAHAEILALRAAAIAAGGWRLDGATLYVTLEPCVMCAGALVNARVTRVVWGCDDPKAGACKTLYAVGADARLNHRFVAEGGCLEEECRRQLRAFFAKLRAQGKK